MDINLKETSQISFQCIIENSFCKYFEKVQSMQVQSLIQCLRQDRYTASASTPPKNIQKCQWFWELRLGEIRGRDLLHFFSLVRKWRVSLHRHPFYMIKLTEKGGNIMAHKVHP